MLTTSTRLVRSSIIQPGQGQDQTESNELTDRNTKKRGKPRKTRLLPHIPTPLVSTPHARRRRLNTRSLRRVIIRLPVRFHHLDSARASLTSWILVFIVDLAGAGAGAGNGAGASLVRAAAGSVASLRRRISQIPVAFKVPLSTRAIHGGAEAFVQVIILAKVFWFLFLGAVEYRVAVEIVAFVLEGADDAAVVVVCGLVSVVREVKVRLGVATGLDDGVAGRQGSAVRLDVCPGELVDFLAAERTTGFLGGDEVVKGPLGRVLGFGSAAYGLLLDLAFAVVAADVEVVEAVRVRLVGDLVMAAFFFGYCVVVVEESVALEVTACSDLGCDGAWLGGRC